MTGFRGTRLTRGHPIINQLKRYDIGSIILFDIDVANNSPVMNVENPEQLRQLTDELRAAAPSPLLIAIDQEGGKVNRLKEERGFPPSISAQVLGQKNDPSATREAALTTAKTLKKAGISLNIAPCVDLNINPDNPIIGKKERSFSNDSAVVTAHAREVINAHHSQGVLCTLKHFPGHGSSSADTHLEFVDVTKTWREEELIPYRTLIDEGLADAVMTSHVFNATFDKKYPATLSRQIIHGMLREQLGFRGVVISDDMQMKAIADRYGLETSVQLAIDAGVDILAFGNNMANDPEIIPKVITIMTGHLSKGILNETRIDESIRRIHRLKYKVSTSS